ncbi:MAG: protein kinase [Myxococcales bacterium]|nr:protein kinase [Myxococcales bacterium]
MQPGTSSPDLAAGATGQRIAGYALGARIRTTACADVYRAERDDVAVTIHLVHAALAARPEIVRAIETQATRAAACTELRNLSATLGAGFEDGLLYVITEAEDGPTLREVLARKHASSGAGLPARGAANVIALVAEALRASGLIHGALTSESVTIARSGRVALADLALGPAHAAAIAAGLVEAPGYLAPELGRGEAPTTATDVYGVGALLYDALVGRPLARGGPRPSEAAPAVAPEVDELIARACAERPDRRFASAAALRELVVDILMSPEEDDGDDVALTSIPIPPALEAAMADGHERWLVSKGHFDFGPFTMKAIVEQVLHGQIHHGHVLMDKDEGGRAKVDEHPLLGPLVDAAKQVRDDARRAHAEVKQQASERKRGVALYGVIGLGVAAAVGAVWLVVTTLTSAKKQQVQGVASVAEASLDVKVSAPKAPPRKGSGGGGGRRSGGGGGGRGGNSGDENLALDMSDDGDGGSETLDMDTVYGVYARHGSQLGRCLQKTGASSASISIIIDGPSGKVTWVKVNGEQSGALHGCLAGVLRGMKFPPIDGPRTRAEFEIGV